MLYSRKVSVLIAAAMITAGCFLGNFRFFVASAQTRLTYPEINTALQTKLPNRSFKNKTELINWIVVQIRNRKIDKPLTKDREDDLRQAGATDGLIGVIKANSPVVETPTPRETVVDLGDLSSRTINLVKPEYTPEARQAGTNGEVKLALELDAQGRVSSVTPLTVLPNGLTEQAVAAVRQTTFTPATTNGKPVRSSGTITYNFKLSKINFATTLALADDYRKKAAYDQAVVEYTRVIDVDAKQSKAFFGRGMCYLMKKNYEQAVSDLDAASKLDPADGDADYYLAIAYDYKGDYSAAATYYDKAVTLKHDLNKSSLIDCLFIEKRKITRDEARTVANDIINACDQSTRNAPEFLTSLIYMKRGIGDRLKSDYDKAISDFETAQRLNPQFASIQGQLHITYNSRGLMYFNKKDYKSAFDDITTAINLMPQSPTPYVNRCVIHLYAWKEFDQAIEDCSTAIKLSGKSSMAYNHRGYAYEMKKNVDAAMADYKKALEIDPGNESAKANLSRIQDPSMKKGQPKP
jgi:TonB family protein